MQTQKNILTRKEVLDLMLAQAGRISEIVQHYIPKDQFKSEDKSDMTPVSVADISSQIVCNLLIKTHLPNDQIIAEESNPDEYDDALLQKAHEIVSEYTEYNLSLEECISLIAYKGPEDTSVSEGFWTIDPVDGTKEFVQCSCFAESIAFAKYEKKGDTKKATPILAGITVHSPGVVMPHLGHDPLQLIADQDEGSEHVTINTIQLDVPKADKIDEQEVMCPLNHVEIIQDQLKHQRGDKPVKEGGMKIMIPKNRIDHPFTKMIMDHFNLTEENIIPVYVTAKLALVATGKIDAYIHFSVQEGWKLKIWDVMPPMTIADAAGAHLSDLEGGQLDITTGSYLENNPSGIIATKDKSVHQQIVDLWSKYGKLA